MLLTVLISCVWLLLLSEHGPKPLQLTENNRTIQISFSSSTFPFTSIFLFLCMHYFITLYLTSFVFFLFIIIVNYSIATTTLCIVFLTHSLFIPHHIFLTFYTLWSKFSIINHYQLLLQNMSATTLHQNCLLLLFYHLYYSYSFRFSLSCFFLFIIYFFLYSFMSFLF